MAIKANSKSIVAPSHARTEPCLASDTDWQAASITHATARHMMVRGLIERDRAVTRYALTDQGNAVLAKLFVRGIG
jgi:hypothetical protein